MAAWIQKRRFCAVVGMILIGCLVFLFLRGPFRLSTYKKAMIARGELLDLKKIISSHPPEAENAARQLDSLISALGFPTKYPNAFSPMKMIAPGLARVSWKMDESISEEDENHLWADIEKQWEEKRNQINQLASLLALAHMDRYLNYQHGFSIQLPHLAKNKAASYWFQIAITAQLRKGNLDDALAYTRNFLRFIRLQFEEPLVISQIVALAYFHLAIPSIWELLQSDVWSSDQLWLIQSELEQFNFVKSCNQALVIQRSFGIMEFAHLRESKKHTLQAIPAMNGKNGRAFSSVGFSTKNASLWSEIAYCFKAIGGWMEDAGIRTASTMRYLHWKLFLSYDDEIAYLERHNYAIDLLSEALRGESLGDVVKTFDQWCANQNKNKQTIITPLMAGNLTMIFDKITYAKAIQQMAITALAIRRYKILNNQLPQDLSLLVPACVSSIPRDPADGQILRYRIAGQDRIRIYSIGTDKIDNGGDPVSINAEANYMFIQLGKDWVWPMTEIGIQKSAP